MAKRLYLVAGHGSGDPGAVGNSYRESDVARKIVTALKTKIGNALNITIYDTRKNLYKSKDYSSFSADDEVIEVHLNAASATSAKGTEILIKTGYSPDALDNALLDAMNDYFTCRGIKYRNDLANMNYFANRKISYRLIEICFITNSSDMTILMDNFDEFITNMASKIVKAMVGIGIVSNATVNNVVSSTNTMETSTSGTLIALDVQKWLNKNYPYSIVGKDSGVDLVEDGVPGKLTWAKVIRNIQRELMVMGLYTGEIDGKWGKLSKAAWRALPTQLDKHNLVCLWKCSLICCGYAPTGGINSIYDQSTKAKTKELQGVLSCNPDGIAGPETANNCYATRPGQVF